MYKRQEQSSNDTENDPKDKSKDEGHHDTIVNEELTQWDGTVEH